MFDSKTKLGSQTRKMVKAMGGYDMGKPLPPKQGDRNKAPINQGKNTLDK